MRAKWTTPMLAIVPTWVIVSCSLFRGYDDLPHRDLDSATSDGSNDDDSDVDVGPIDSGADTADATDSTVAEDGTGDCDADETSADADAVGETVAEETQRMRWTPSMRRCARHRRRPA